MILLPPQNSAPPRLRVEIRAGGFIAEGRMSGLFGNFWTFVVVDDSVEAVGEFCFVEVQQ